MLSGNGKITHTDPGSATFGSPLREALESHTHPLPGRSCECIWLPMPVNTYMKIRGGLIKKRAPLLELIRLKIFEKYLLLGLNLQEFEEKA